MNDEVAMRVLNCGTYPAEQVQPPIDRQALLLAEAVDRYAVDELHREPGKTVRRHATVQQTSDIGVIQRRENLPLIDEAANEALTLRAPRRQQLDRYAFPILVVSAFGEIDGPHASATDLAQNAIGTDLKSVGASIEVGKTISEEWSGEFDRRRIQERARFGRQHCRSCCTHRVIAGKGAVQVCGALNGRELERVVENLEDLPPPGGGSGRRRALLQSLRAS